MLNNFDTFLAQTYYCDSIKVDVVFYMIHLIPFYSFVKGEETSKLLPNNEQSIAFIPIYNENINKKNN